MKFTEETMKGDLLFYWTLEKNNYTIIWVDEAWRWTWAWPIVAAAVCVPKDFVFPEDINSLIKDSKKLNAVKRKKVYDYIIWNLPYGIWIAEATDIDIHWIQPMNKFVMNEAVKNLIKNYTIVNKTFSLIDWTLKFDDFINEFKSVVNGDDFINEISLASIVAKEFRDELLNDYKKFDGLKAYGFENHKWYGTKEHIEAIKNHWVIKWIHRFSYKPIKVEFEKWNLNKDFE